ncbi:MAG TPA: SDR family oxidoreductase [Bryobacteraceae bacterium]|nr:SDR family oxidoreductase [Bryobacteraceae bacterium]
MVEGMAKETAVVVGGTGSLGSGVAEALARRNLRVLTLSRSRHPGRSPALENTEHLVGDATDEGTAARVLDEIRPRLIVLCAGVQPLLRPIQLHTWETFSEAWEVDTKSAFVWLRNALLLPARPGTQIILVSSAAGLQGSPLSGGYAGAKRTQWFIAKYAALEADRLKLGIRIHCLLPVLTPIGIGQAAMKAYASRAGISVEEFAKRFNPPVTAEVMGQAVLDLTDEPGKWNQLAYQLDGKGLTALT